MEGNLIDRAAMAWQLVHEPTTRAVPNIDHPICTAGCNLHKPCQLSVHAADHVMWLAAMHHAGSDSLHTCSFHSDPNACLAHSILAHHWRLAAANKAHCEVACGNLVTMGPDNTTQWNF